MVSVCQPRKRKQVRSQATCYLPTCHARPCNGAWQAVAQTRGCKKDSNDHAFHDNELRGTEDTNCIGAT